MTTTDLDFQKEAGTNQPNRPITLRTSGHRHGPITRLMSPSDIGTMVKPFVFLDHFNAPPAAFRGFAMHPHSGLATLTWLVGGSTTYEDTTGKQGVIPQGGVEWMQAGGGVWHTGEPIGDVPLEGFQLWVALPPELENAPAQSIYLSPESIPKSGPVKVLLGKYGGQQSLIPSPAPINYLAVTLQDGEEWLYQPPDEHDIAWIAVARGKLHTSGTVDSGEMVVFVNGNAPIRFYAEGHTEFVLGSATKHPYPLALGTYSVHTNARSLAEGVAEIRRIGETLAAQGKLGQR